MIVIVIVSFVFRDVLSCNRNENHASDQSVTVITETAAMTDPTLGPDQRCHNLTSPMIFPQCLNHLNDYTWVYISLGVNETEQLLDAINKSESVCDCKNHAIDFACHFIYPNCSIHEECVVESTIQTTMCLQFPCENYCLELRKM